MTEKNSCPGRERYARNEGGPPLMDPLPGWRESPATRYLMKSQKVVKLTICQCNFNVLQGGDSGG